MREKSFIVAQFCFPQVQEHDGPIEAVSISMDSPIVGKLGLEPEQIGGEFLIGVLLDEGFQLLYW